MEVTNTMYGHYKCCFCGKDKPGFGNSAWPLYPDDSEHRCCDSCNKYTVIPTRVTDMIEYSKTHPDFRPED